MKSLFFTLMIFFSSQLRGEQYYEGTNTFRGSGAVGYSWMVQFLPYNPVIVEVGAFEGKETVSAAKTWPRARLIAAFEPNPRAYQQLQEVTKGIHPNLKTYPLALAGHNGMANLYLSRGPTGQDLSFEYESALSPPLADVAFRYQGPELEVSCVVLDDWCRENQIEKIDILRLEVEGLELEILKSSPKILRNTKLIIVPSFFSAFREKMPNYFALKGLLAEAHFVPLAHWYEAGGRGLAVYISEEMFDAYFVRCLGLGLGGLLYP
jgi:FkbM family methyltransferase